MGVSSGGGGMMGFGGSAPIGAGGGGGYGMGGPSRSAYEDGESKA
jgi:hypothetical protein